jgi:hypothetical protein
MSKEPRVVTVRVYVAGVLVAEEEVAGALSVFPAKGGKTKGTKGK